MQQMQQLLTVNCFRISCSVWLKCLELNSPNIMQVVTFTLAGRDWVKKNSFTSVNVSAALPAEQILIYKHKLLITKISFVCSNFLIIPWLMKLKYLQVGLHNYFDFNNYVHFNTCISYFIFVQLKQTWNTGVYFCCFVLSWLEATMI